VSYEVVWVDAFDDPKQGGQCWREGRIIYLKRGLSAARTFEIFIHELLHAMEFEHAIPISHAVIEGLEGAVAQLLKLNGWLPPARRKGKK
jgi:hypothetical protein